MIKLMGLGWFALGTFGTYGFAAASIGWWGTNNLLYLVPLTLASAEIARAGALQLVRGEKVEPFGWIGE